MDYSKKNKSAEVLSVLFIVMRGLGRSVHKAANQTIYIDEPHTQCTLLSFVFLSEDYAKKPK